MLAHIQSSFQLTPADKSTPSQVYPQPTLPQQPHPIPIPTPTQPAATPCASAQAVASASTAVQMQATVPLSAAAPIAAVAAAHVAPPSMHAGIPVHAVAPMHAAAQPRIPPPSQQVPVAGAAPPLVTQAEGAAAKDDGKGRPTNSFERIMLRLSTAYPYLARYVVIALLHDDITVCLCRG